MIRVTFDDRPDQPRISLQRDRKGVWHGLLVFPGLFPAPESHDCSPAEAVRTLLDQFNTWQEKQKNA